MVKERLRLPEDLLGQPAIKVVEKIVERNPAVRSLCFSRFPYSLLKPIWLPREEIVSGERIEKSIEKKNRSTLLSSRYGERVGYVLFSKVRLKRLWPRKYGYIPMIDFKGRFLGYDQPFPWPNWILFRLKRILRAIGQEEGVIIDSGYEEPERPGSLHYWGLNIMNGGERDEFIEALSQFPEIRIGPGDDDILKPDPKWLRNISAPHRMNLRFTESLIHDHEPVVVATL